MEVKRITSLLLAMIVALSLVVMPQTASAIGTEVEPAKIVFDAADTADGKVYDIAGNVYTAGLTDQGGNKSKINTNVRLTYNLPENIEAGYYSLSFDYLSAYPSNSSSTNHPYIQVFVDGTAATDIISLERTSKDWNNAISNAELYDSCADDEIMFPITADSETVTIQVHNTSSLTAAGVISPVPSGFTVTSESSFTFTKVSDIVGTDEPTEPENPVVPEETSRYSVNVADTSDGKVYDIAGNVYAAGLTDQGSNKSKIYANVKLTYNLPEDIESGNYALSFDYLSAYPSSSSSTNHPYLQIFVDGIAVTDIISLARTSKDWNNAISNAEPYDSYADDEILIPITADSETVMIQVHNTSSLTIAGVTSPVPSGFVVATETSFTFTKISDIAEPEEPSEPEEPTEPEETSGYSFDAADTADGKVYDIAGNVYAAGLTDQGSNKSKIYANVKLTYNLPEDIEAGNYSLSFDYLSAYHSSSSSTNHPYLQIFVDGIAVTDIISLARTSKDWNDAISNAETYDSYADDKILIPITADSETVTIQVHNTSSLTSAGVTSPVPSGFVVATENSFTLIDVTYPVNYEAEIKSFQTTINETDETVSVKLKVENKLDNGESLKLFAIVALYDADECLIDCEKIPVVVEAGVPFDNTDNPATVSIDSENGEVARVKVFLWGGSGFNDSNRKSYATAVERIR